MTLLRRAATLALPLAIASLTLAGCDQAKPDKAFGEKVRAYLLEHPEVLMEASQKLQEKQAAQQAASSQKAIGQYRQAIERDPRDIVINPAGSITVTEFFDYRCGYCRHAAPEIVELVQKNPDIRLVLKDFVIFGRDSEAAARIALGAKDQGKSLELYKALMAENALDAAGALRIAKNVGIDLDKAKPLGESQAVTQHLADTDALAKTLALSGTPAFIVGDTLVPGADINALRLAIEQTRASAAKAG
ncbi:MULTISPECIES: DsbA family protein [unclassified Caulobacter]|jgi:protein-disulfide isomerase|uniref:DsbA family protein n=1 Tax=unclassified Caulobacter TaxID=2648921 RepID=UPI0006FCCCEB|nr:MULTISPECIES: DsbA family protein [unclassified Caulobacter]KQV57180.1 disulfide bond formation protein DsbA [Caulobacter sp. Root342]KQV66752.1 disulfide bond formation protein DsbA [Caulobacter sp. Root343]